MSGVSRSLQWGLVQVDPSRHLAVIAGQVYDRLAPRYFDFLRLLVSLKGAVLSRPYAVRMLWRREVHDREVDVLVCRLRRALRPEHRGLIEGVYCRGYRLAARSVVPS